MITELGFFGVDSPLGALAENVTYDNTESGLNAANAQEAIDELAARPQGGGGSDAIIMTDIDLIDKSVSGSASAWGNSATIVGYDKTFTKRSLLTQVEILVYQSAVGANVNFYLGTIDQRNWLLPRKTFTAQVTSLGETISGQRVSIIDLSALNIIAEPGEVLFMSPQKTTSNDATFAWSTSALISGVKCLYTTDILNALTESSSRAVMHIKISAKEIDTFLALAEDVERTNELVQANTEAIARSQIIYDEVTGTPYRLVVSNGMLSVKATRPARLLVLSHSYCQYQRMGWWQCDDNRGMAATVVTNDFPSQLKDILGSTSMTKKNVADFERQLAGYDFATGWNLTDNYDAIVLFVGANVEASTSVADIQAGFEAAIDYLKTACPSADIFIASLSGGNIFAGQQAAASAKQVSFIDIRYISISGHWMGAYYFGESNGYYAVVNGGVAGHPGDYTHWNIAKGLALGMGVEASTEKAHALTLSQTTGGTISVKDAYGVEGGVISIKCEANEGKAISALSVVDEDGTTIQATQRTNDYGTFYTFIMPARDVTITPTWTNV